MVCICLVALTTQVVRQGGIRQSSGMHQGVPWFRLADALQEELRKTLVDAMRLLRINIGAGGAGGAMSTTGAEAVGAAQQRAGSMTLMTQGAGGAVVASDSDVIRGLDEVDMQFIKDKLVSEGERGARDQPVRHLFLTRAWRMVVCWQVTKPYSDCVRITDFSVFCEG